QLGPHLQVVADGEPGEELAALGDDGDAGPRPRRGAEATDVLAIENNPTRRHDRSVDGQQQAALARAVGPDDRGDRAARSPKAHASEGRGPPISDGEALDDQLM